MQFSRCCSGLANYQNLLANGKPRDTAARLLRVPKKTQWFTQVTGLSTDSLSDAHREITDFFRGFYGQNQLVMSLWCCQTLVNQRWL